MRLDHRCKTVAVPSGGNRIYGVLVFHLAVRMIGGGHRGGLKKVPEKILPPPRPPPENFFSFSFVSRPITYTYGGDVLLYCYHGKKNATLTPSDLAQLSHCCKKQLHTCINSEYFCPRKRGIASQGLNAALSRRYLFTVY